MPCKHYLIINSNGDDYCYIIFKKMWLKKRIPFGRVIYASNTELFQRSVDRLKLYWALRLGVAFIVTDQAVVTPGRKRAFTKTLPREFPSLFKSKELTAEDIKPPLYTLPLLVGYRLH